MILVVMSYSFLRFFDEISWEFKIVDPIAVVIAATLDVWSLWSILFQYRCSRMIIESYHVATIEVLSDAVQSIEVPVTLIEHEESEAEQG